MRIFTRILFMLMMIVSFKVFAENSGKQTKKTDRAITPTIASSDSSIKYCSRKGSIAIGTATNYGIYLELQRRKKIDTDFETWAVSHLGGIDSIASVKDDLNLLYEGNIRSPALFGSHIFFKCIDTEPAKIQWINLKAVPVCFLTLEIARSIGNSKHANIKKEEVVPSLRLMGHTKFIDKVLGLSNVNLFIDEIYKASNISEEVDFQESMIFSCLTANIQTYR